jgi:hypothetical protein
MARRERAPWPGLLFAAGLLAAACGCAGSATVSGKVTYRGRPVVAGSVVFLSADRTARSGVIEPDGSYTVRGVRPGAVKIGVISRDPAKKARGAARPAGWFPLPRQFENPESSGVGTTVGSGRVQHDIDLDEPR